MEDLFFYASKLIWMVIRPESWLAGLFLFGTLALWKNRLRSAKVILSAGLLALFGIGIFPLGLLLIAPLEARYPASPELQKVAGIIVLGGAEEADRWAASGEIALNDAGERFLAGIALAHRFPNVPVVFSGATPNLLGEGTETGPLIERIFTAAGIAPGRILIEGQSRNTAENARLTRELLEVQDATVQSTDSAATWIIVTSAFHMPRAVASFEAAGWRTITPWPTDFRGGVYRHRIGWHLAENLEDLNTAAKELVGLIAYRLTYRAMCGISCLNIQHN